MARTDKEFEAWCKDLQQIIEQSETRIGLMPEVKSYLFAHGHSPEEAFQAALKIHKMAGSPLKEGEQPPYDDGAAIAKDKRVMKVNSYKGDFCPDGELGTTVGYRKVMGKDLYYVRWDCKPEAVNGVYGKSLKEVLNE